MKLTRKFITAGVAGIMALSMTAAVWAAEPKISDQKVHAGGVKLNIPVVTGAVGGKEVDDKVNLAIDFNITKKLYNYLPAVAVTRACSRIIMLSSMATAAPRPAVSL